MRDVPDTPQKRATMRTIARSAAMIGMLLGCGLSIATIATSAAEPSEPSEPAEPKFEAVVSGRPLVFPQDMGAHPSFGTEWWYATGWLTTPDNKPLGFQITFFRSATGHDSHDPGAFAPSQLIFAHAALSDPATGHLQHDQRIARQGFGLAYAKTGDTDLKLDTWTMKRHPDGRYTVDADAGRFRLALTFTPTQPVLLQGERGYSQKGPLAAQASYYYSEPQLAVSGSVTRETPGSDGAQHARVDTAVTGKAWLDHEWSSTLLSPDASGWDWLGANLDDGSALMAFVVRSRQGGVIWSHAVLRDPRGQMQSFGPDKVGFTPIERWRSPHTGTTYPVGSSVRTGDDTWTLAPLMDDQELDSRGTSGAVYWEGAVRVSRAGQPVGHGYLELTGYDKPIGVRGK
ncbi:carotenoid 1,2-hydratase [Paraburkholderia sp.]|uniref:lipocalin-like domain-containing protein n=1 Tax=Paraburkholderia sp. TaxID=1926495 RepID=UPI002388D2D5|nr:carotenoid 1,2-hydratase [Paraburkholderia sp.]MDE1182417.1 carotenoid 1,2-hydratase [Paraburkholderia sp.]